MCGIVGFLDKTDKPGVRQGIDGKRDVGDADREDRDGTACSEFQDRHGIVLREACLGLSS